MNRTSPDAAKRPISFLKDGAQSVGKKQRLELKAPDAFKHGVQFKVHPAIGEDDDSVAARHLLQVIGEEQASMSEDTACKAKAPELETEIFR